MMYLLDFYLVVKKKKKKIESLGPKVGEIFVQKLGDLFFGVFSKTLQVLQRDHPCISYYLLKI